LQFVSGIPASTPVIAVTGSQDDNTLPEFARRWVEHAASKGAKSRFEEVAGRNHSTILEWPEIQHRVNELVKELYP
jgi:pimeloyl-ACP methyl ester carboxylesterase